MGVLNQVVGLICMFIYVSRSTYQREVVEDGQEEGRGGRDDRVVGGIMNLDNGLTHL